MSMTWQVAAAQRCQVPRDMGQACARFRGQQGLQQADWRRLGPGSCAQAFEGQAELRGVAGWA